MSWLPQSEEGEPEGKRRQNEVEPEHKKQILMNFNQIVKIIIVVAVLVGLVAGFIYVQEDAKRQVAEVQKDTKPDTDNVTIKGYKLKEVDDQNRVRWQLQADTGTVNSKTHLVNLKGIVVEYFNGPEVKMRLTAPAGEANESERHVKLSRQNGQKVVATGDGGKTHMETNILELSKNNRFIASDGVNINLPGVAKISGNRAEGNINFSELNNFKIMGNTHAEIVVN